MTIHKSQGQSIPALYVDFKGIFEYGQAYVALSRALDSSTLQITNFSKDKIKAYPSSVEFYTKIQSDETDIIADTGQEQEIPVQDISEAIEELSIQNDTVHKEPRKSYKFIGVRGPNFKSSSVDPETIEE